MVERVLVILAHFFKPEAMSRYSSTLEHMRAARRQALERVLTSWRGLYGPQRELNIAQKKFVCFGGVIRKLDIVILINNSSHLLDDELIKRYRLKIQNIETDNPRLLPFGAHGLIKKWVTEYDWFVYSEDDLVPHDPALFGKQALFGERFGSRRVLQPNRFELNQTQTYIKTYVDGPLRQALIEELWRHVREESPSLLLNTELGPVAFVRAVNPHSGFFMISGEQAKYWVQQPHFMDMDCSFISPLESAASLSLLKTFSLYKAAAPQFSFFEIEHMDQKFSSMRLPQSSAPNDQGVAKQDGKGLL